MSQWHLLKSKRFSPFFWTQFWGAFNDNLFKNALVVLIAFQSTAILGMSPAQMVSLASGIFILPFFLFSATAGQIADKYEKSKLIRWIKLAEIFIMIFAVVGFFNHQVGFLLVVLFLMGLQSTFFGPIKFSILPQHIGATDLVGANALVEMGTFLAILLGTLLGGILIALPDGQYWVSFGVVAVAWMGWRVCKKIPRAEAVDPALKIQWLPFWPTLQVLRLTRQTRVVFNSVLGISWFWFYGAAVLSLLPPFCKDVLQAGPQAVTLFLAIFSIGVGVGSTLCERFSRQVLELGLVPFGSIGMSVFAADLAFAEISGTGGISLRIVIDLFLIAVFCGFYIVPLNTLIQERSEPTQRSRVIAGNNILNSLFMVVSSLMGVGLLAMNVSIQNIFLFIALLNAAVALYIYSVIPEFFLRFVVWVLANIAYRLRVSGRLHIPKTGAALLICNHVSFVDWLIIAAGVPRPVRFVMDNQFAKGFFMRHLMKDAKIIPIASQKVNPHVLSRAFEKIAETLNEGELVCIFPEGAITRDGKMAAFRPGIEKILKTTPVPVIPMALRGLWGSFFSREGGRAGFKRPKRFWSRVELRIGAEVEPKNADLERLFVEVSRLHAGN